MVALPVLFSFAPTLVYSPPKNYTNHLKNTSLSSPIFLYRQLALGSKGLSFAAFQMAIAGMQELFQAGKIENDALLTIIDFSLPSSQKRLFVINLLKGKLLYHTYVAHGKNSGKLMATHFSNRPNSYESSLGFYVTENTYRGKHGFALRLNGLESGINDNAFNRGIVIHSAPYASEKFIQAQGYLGRSEGCPALPPKIAPAIIQTIKNGSCVFAYSSGKHYLAASSVLQQIPDSLNNNFSTAANIRL
ncbi:murein L,D-transpeptidase catalytic domain family protein [Hydrotalea sp.]|uniref:murein L,D-transpeptidase catalytic domain family protein n=1 Tax=Hydrotalea sp. TaxID=2881279 RepID=UPI0026025451|nr:murein L,D-transpeptidase catalytic domain family protein [Hydrotalea sp.]